MIVSTVHAVSAGWLPLGDDAIIAVRALDVFSTHPPLLGQYSVASSVIGEPVLSPGPLLYWLLAVPVRLGRTAPVIAMGLLNASCVVGIVALAKRRGGTVFMFAAAAAVAVMCGSLGAPVLRDIWNPAAAVLPFTLLFFLAWSVACGEYRLLPLTALVASFTAQAQFTYVLPDLILVGVGLGFLIASRARIPRRWLVATLLIVAVCWSLPAVEEVVHRPGNIEKAIQVATSSKPTLGIADGWHSAVRAVGITPWWLKSPQAPFTRISEVVYEPEGLSIATACVALLALAALVLAAVRARRRDLAAAGVLALGLIVAVGVVTAGTPSAHGLFAVISYTLWWASPAGMYCWLTLGFGLVALVVSPLVGDGMRRRLGRATNGRPAAQFALAGVGICAVLVVAVAAASGGKRDRLESAFRPAAAAARTVEASARDAGRVLVAGVPGEASTLIQSAIVYELRRSGIPFVVASLRGIGTRYDPAKRPHDAVLTVYEQRAPAGSGEPVAVVQLDDFPTDVPGPPRKLVVTLRRIRR